MWTKTFLSVYRQSVHVDIAPVRSHLSDQLLLCFFRRILAPVSLVVLSILTQSVRPALLTVATDVRVLNKVSLVNAVKKVYSMHTFTFTTTITTTKNYCLFLDKVYNIKERSKATALC